MADHPPAGGARSFGALLRFHRERLGLTQDQLAGRSRMGARTIRNLEAGRVRRPRSDSVRLLADALGLDDAERAALRRTIAPSEPAPVSVRPPTMVGRQPELARAEALVRCEDVRLLTLTGPPGVGKTCLALALATRLHDAMPDGVEVVDLAPLTDPAQVALAIGQVLGPGLAGPRPALEQVVAQIGSRRMLLVLDNFEHLLAATPLVAELLGRCPELRLLVTSREVLRLRGERELPVPPLPLADAVRLFVRRVEARVPGFALTGEDEAPVAEICRRLDCLPLALELVAPWLRLMDPEALLERLRDRLRLLVDGPRDLPERQRTMRAALRWSYDLLEPEEQAMFRSLAVFAGGATLEALEAVHGEGRRDPLGLVGRLVDENLAVRRGERGEPRVGMLETVRQYGQELLAASGDGDRVRAAHARHYAALAERIERDLERMDLKTWLDQTEREIDNLRTALRWAREAGEVELGLRTAARLLPLWERRGHIREGITWLDGWPEANGEVARDVRAQALHARAVLAFRLADYDDATAAGNASLALYREVGDRRGIAGALNYLAGVEFELGHVDRAVELCEESLALRRQVGSPDDVVCSLRNLAMLMFERADRRASDLLEESVSILRGLGRRPSLVWSLNLLADLALREGRLTAARAYLDECFGVIAGDRHPVLMSEVHNTRGHLARAEGDPAGAAASYREALRIRLRLGHRGKAATDIQGLAAVAWMEGRAERAAVLYAAAAAATAASGHHAERHEREKHDPVLADVREALGVEAFRAAWAAGARLAFDEAVALALDRH